MVVTMQDRLLAKFVFVTLHDEGLEVCSEHDIKVVKYWNVVIYT